jgi:hypothetical protein
MLELDRGAARPVISLLAAEGPTHGLAAIPLFVPLAVSHAIEVRCLFGEKQYVRAHGVALAEKVQCGARL